MQGLLEPISFLRLLDMFAWCFGDPRGLRSSRLWDVDKFKVPRASSVLLTPNSSAQEALDIVAGPRMPIRTSGLWLRLSGEGLRSSGTSMEDCGQMLENQTRSAAKVSL